MPTEVLMPALSPTMTEGKIARWLKSEGEPVRAGDVLAEIETDKATMEFEAVDDGVLAKIVIPEGTEHVAVNTPIAVIAGNGEEAGAAETIAPAAKAPEKTPKKTPPHPSPPPAPSAVAQRTVPAESEYTGKTTTMTVREALRDAMAEEMRRDDTVFLIGEEVAEYQGAYKVSQGLLQEFGPRRVIDTPITEQGFTGLGVGAGFAGLRPIVEFMTFNFAMQAIAELEKAGIAAEVIDLRTLRPFDVETVVASVKKTNRIVAVEEGWPFAGIGAELAAIMMEECFDWLDAPVKRVAGKDVPLPYAANLERLAVPQVEDIVVAAREVAYR